MMNGYGELVWKNERRKYVGFGLKENKMVLPNIWLLKKLNLVFGKTGK